MLPPRWGQIGTYGAFLYRSSSSSWSTALRRTGAGMSSRSTSASCTAGHRPAHPQPTTSSPTRTLGATDNGHPSRRPPESHRPPTPTPPRRPSTRPRVQAYVRRSVWCRNSRALARPARRDWLASGACGACGREMAAATTPHRWCAAVLVPPSDPSATASAPHIKLQWVSASCPLPSSANSSCDLVAVAHTVWWRLWRKRWGFSGCCQEPGADCGVVV